MTVGSGWTVGVGLLDGKVAIVTGAGRGLGRGEAIELARQGASVVVNEFDAEVGGGVVDEIRSAGGAAVLAAGDVSDVDVAGALVATAVEEYGGLDALVNNAGILRDRTVVNMSPQEWDDVIRVHLRGTFAPLRHAGAYWRARSKAGEPVDAAIINTTSSSGIYGNAGQGNYGAAKAGIAGLTVIAARELGRYGVTVNAVAPAALTRMTEGLTRWQPGSEPQDFDPHAPDNIAPLVVWLGSDQARGITGRVFNVRGGVISVAEGWRAGPGADKGARWDPAELGEIIPGLVEKAAPNVMPDGRTPEA
jgi:NAD(P)-dependent dehydrogenase (short-subunit alcohol dehydrogenase family)